MEQNVYKSVQAGICLLPSLIQRNLQVFINIESKNFSNQIGHIWKFYVWLNPVCTRWITEVHGGLFLCSHIAFKLILSVEFVFQVKRSPNSKQWHMIESKYRFFLTNQVWCSCFIQCLILLELMKTQVNTLRGKRNTSQIFAFYLTESVVSYTRLSLSESMSWNYNLWYYWQFNSCRGPIAIFGIIPQWNPRRKMYWDKIDQPTC